MGICGIASAPARMMTSEQTVARIGRVMNVSTNMLYVTKRGDLSFCGADAAGPRASLSGSPSTVSGGRLDGSTITDFLKIRNDHLLPFLDPAADDVAVANELADGHRLQPRDKTLLRRLGHEHEILTTDAVDGDDGHRDFRIVAPDDPRTHVLQDPHAGRTHAQRRLHEHGLRRIVGARSDERDRIRRDDGAIAIEQLHGETLLQD